MLFICTGNSARSQMAEAILREMTHGRVDVFSAGSEPKPEIHPLARHAVAKLLQIGMVDQRPKPMSEFFKEKFDFVISVCDRAAESCPEFPGDPERIRWSFEDPATAMGTELERSRIFDRTARDLMGRIRIWLALPRISARIGPSTGSHAI